MLRTLLFSTISSATMILIIVDGRIMRIIIMWIARGLRRHANSQEEQVVEVKEGEDLHGDCLC